MINTLTLNPAIDAILYVDTFRRNVTNRARASAQTMGGKGTHVSMNLSLMGTPSRAFGFGFGGNGQRIIDMLQASGVEPCFVYDPQGESRVNTLIVEESTKDSTLISTRGPQPTPAQTQALYALMEQRIQEGDYLALSGDASNFSDPRIYNRILERLSPKRLRVVLDASGESLRQCVGCAPYLLKPNEDELSQLTGLPTDTQQDVIKAIGALDRYHIPIVAVTLGGRGSIVRTQDRLYRVHSPQVRVFNTVGCGDCFVAGLLHGFAQGVCLEDNLSYATAAGAAMAEEALSVNFDPGRAVALCSQVRIERL